MGQTQMGFGRVIPSKNREIRASELLQLVQPEDLVKFGLLPEFVGRFPVIVHFDALDEEAMVQVLWQPKNSFLKQYQCLFEMENVKLTLTQEAMVAVAREAIRRKSGARGLRSILEEIMLDVMYDLPDMVGVIQVVIDEDVVNGTGEPVLIQDERESA